LGQQFFKKKQEIVKNNSNTTFSIPTRHIDIQDTPLAQFFDMQGTAFNEKH